MARILIVDDSSFIRMKLKEILESAGHEVVAEASNGMIASVKYKEYRPDIVTMDISMPTTDGIEALRKITGEDPGAKIIMISAMGQKLMVLEALKSGAKHFILKPFVKEKVIEVVQKVIDQNPSRIVRKL